MQYAFAHEALDVYRLALSVARWIAASRFRVLTAWPEAGVSCRTGFRASFRFGLLAWVPTLRWRLSGETAFIEASVAAVSDGETSEGLAGALGMKGGVAR